MEFSCPVYTQVYTEECWYHVAYVRRVPALVASRIFHTYDKFMFAAHPQTTLFLQHSFILSHSPTISSSIHVLLPKQRHSGAYLNVITPWFHFVPVSLKFPRVSYEKVSCAVWFVDVCRDYCCFILLFSLVLHSGTYRSSLRFSLTVASRHCLLPLFYAAIVRFPIYTHPS